MKAVTFDGLGAARLLRRALRRRGQLERATSWTTRASRPRGRGWRSSTRTSAAARRASTRRRRCCAGASRRWSASRSPTSSSATASRSACPASTASEADVAALMAAVEEDPAQDLVVDVEALTATYGGATLPGRDCRPACASSSSTAPGTPPASCSRRRRGSARRRALALRQRVRVVATAQGLGSERGPPCPSARRARRSALPFTAPPLRAATGTEAGAPRLRALLALTELAQVRIRVDPRLVAVAPDEAERVAPDRGGSERGPPCPSARRARRSALPFTPPPLRAATGTEARAPCLYAHCAH